MKGKRSPPPERRRRTPDMTSPSAIRLGRRLLADTHGLTTVEYTIVLCLIAALCVGAWSQFGEDLEGYVTGARVSLRDHLNTSGKGATP
jgi:Flp pilus assembly pilin Flp